jgi:aspartyl-tRNA(Asn)/glutamyl-tRNA(Gln) amidotransferase subunit A
MSNLKNLQLTLKTTKQLKKFSSLQEVKNALAVQSISCRQLVQYYLENIENKKHLNAFLEVYSEEALTRADEVDEKLKQGNAGKLAGMVIGLKDNICYQGHHVSASSKILLGFESLYSATVTEKLLAQDAIIIGRLNCDEFAMGASNENSAYGPVLNDADNTKVPGGSSGGSAVAVQADLCLAALGSDTGGSVRQPASFTGTFGMKPTYGRISRWGLLSYASSFDQIGPITSSMEDMALLLEIIAGADEFDATVSKTPVPDYSLMLTSSKKHKVAYIQDCLTNPGLDTEVAQQFTSLIDKLKEEGHTVEPVSFPYLDYMVPCYYVLTTAEASSNLARYSGLLFGHRSPMAENLESTFKKSRSEGFGPEVQRRIMTGTFVLSSDHYDAYYTKAQQVRRVIQDKTFEILDKYDFILLPTTPGPAFEIGAKSADPIAMYLADIFTVQAPLAGIPAISIPGAIHSNGMPFGIQIMANYFEEGPMMAFGNDIHQLIT